mmetsp:Transcript_17725/g.54530  ORF Transcript_17725/g.54530 Transcript_17725/m.54530 type:complete len:508 (+) Transcript_17725:42-1565(+)
MRSIRHALALAALAAGARPNIVFVLTDDQDVALGGMEPMVQTKALFEAHGGASFRHYYVATPICCPSRMEMLSGRYGHNVRDASQDAWPADGGLCGDEAVEASEHNCGCMRMNCSKAFEADTYATALQRAGYATAYFGKYLNPPAMVPYCRNETRGPIESWPPGWDMFYGMCDQASTPYGAYYNMTWVDSVAGAITYTGDDPTNYTTSLVGNRTVEFIETATAPFFVAAAVRAPHAPQLPPPWYKDALPNVTIPRSGAYNASTEGKPAWMATNPPLTAKEGASYDAKYADRWRSLLAVDDLVAAVFEAVNLEDTYVFYTSDHGFHLGHFRLPPLKMHKYEMDVRVPLLVAGPGVVAAHTVSAIAGAVDLAPTFVDLAGATLLAPPDGRSLRPLLEGAEAPWPRDEFLIEYMPVVPYQPGATRVDDLPDNNWRALRVVNASTNVLYAHTTTVDDYDFENASAFFVELYDLAADPHQLTNVAAAAPAGVLEWYRDRLETAWGCEGATCP